MARALRPRTLAAVFGVYFLLIALVSWYFSMSLSGVWYTADITRWVYTTYMLVAAIFLVGLAGLAVSIRRALGRRIVELDRRLGSGSAGPMSDALPPPLPETVSGRDSVDRDIDELLESLSEVEASAAREAEAMETASVATVMETSRPMVTDAGAVVERERLRKRQKTLGRFVLGPGLAAAFVLGISGMMLPGSDGFAQYYFQLNTALILGIGYSWLGVGAYIASTIYAVVSTDDRRKD